jgi:hypothetical protein
MLGVVLLGALLGCAGATDKRAPEGMGKKPKEMDASPQRDFANSDGGGQRTVVDATLRDAGSDSRVECESVPLLPEVEREIIPGNLLIIFDRSGSMEDTWSTGRPKWVDARNAVMDALSPLQDDLGMVGAILFPSDDGCMVSPIESAAQFELEAAPDFLYQWARYWGQPSALPSGRTPLLAAQQRADSALSAASLSNATAVIVITDGVPNCSGGPDGGVEPLANLTPLPEAWLADDIKTYVLGLPGAHQGDAPMTLDGVASAGGTEQYIPANDPTVLQHEITKILTGDVIGTFFPCEIELDTPPDDPDDIHVIVVADGERQDVPRAFGDEDAWTTNSTGSEITFHGDFCAAASAGNYDTVSIEFGCVDLPPAPPPVVD